MCVFVCGGACVCVGVCVAVWEPKYVWALYFART